MCNLVEEKEIKAILDKGAGSAREIQLFTRAGTSCGKCLPQIDKMAEAHQNKSKTQQKKLNLGF